MRNTYSMCHVFNDKQIYYMYTLCIYMYNCQLCMCIWYTIMMVEYGLLYISACMITNYKPWVNAIYHESYG